MRNSARLRRPPPLPPRVTFENELQTTVVPRKAAAGTATYTRATIATVEDFEGLVKDCISGEVRFKGARRVENLLSNTENITTGTFSISAVTITAGISDPDGGTAASTITSTGAGAVVFKTVASAVATNEGVNSVWVRRRTGTGVVNIRDPNNGSTAITAQLTSSWQRFASPVDVPTGGNFLWGIALATTADAIDIAFPQLEEVTGQGNQNPSEYVSVDVESSPFHGAMVDGVKYFKTANGNTVASNIVTEAVGAAFDATDSHNDADGPEGYLREEARENICLQASVMENAAWTATNVTKSDNDVASPTGRITAATLTATAANGTVIQDLGVIGSAIKAYGLWVKRKTGTGDIDLTLDNGGSWTTITVTAAWTRVEISATLANPDVGIRIVTDADAIYVWNNQCEAASELSSDIITVAAAVTRNADVLTYPTADNQQDAAGTCSAQVKATDWTTEVGQIVGDGTEALLLADTTNSGVQAFDGTNTANGPAGTPSGIEELASTWGTDLIAYSGGSGGTAASYDGAFTLAQINIGATTFNGTIRKVKLFNKESTAKQIRNI